MKVYIIGSRGKLGSCIAKLAQTVTNPEEANVIIDVSSPSALSDALSYKKPLVIGTTGHSPDQIAHIKASPLPIFLSANFSPGIALLKQFLKHNSQWFDKAKIEDVHHFNKKDAPSGTALALASCLKIAPEITSIREGDVIGKHTVTLNLQDESLIIQHNAHSRELFARGAILAAKFILGKKPGLYSMNDLIESGTI